MDSDSLRGHRISAKQRFETSRMARRELAMAAERAERYVHTPVWWFSFSFGFSHWLVGCLLVTTTCAR